MTWQLARPIVDLFAQWNAASPNRSRTSDGTLGDAAHAARASDHNPDSAGWVHAGDVTFDPGHGADVHAWIRRLIAAGPPAVLKYAISSEHGDPARSQIWTPDRGWHTYNGANPHNHHCHISVVTGSEHTPTDWRVKSQPLPPINPQPQPSQEDDMYLRDKTTGAIVHVYGERFRRLSAGMWARRQFLGARATDHTSGEIASL